MRVFDFYQLEDRVLLNADSPEGIDAVELLLEAALIDELQEESENTSTSVTAASSESSQSEPAENSLAPASTDEPLHDPSRRLEIIFVDAAVEDADSLIDGLRDESGDSAVDWVVIRLSPQGDGLGQISAALAEVRDVDAVHILSHANGDSLHLAGERLTADSLRADAGNVARWADSLSDDADLLIYGCDLASTAEGRSLLESLAALSGADVAASDDATGSESLGGDWHLEYALGSIETSVAFNATAQQSWYGVLDTATFKQGDVNGYTGTQDTELHEGNPDADVGSATSISIDLANGLYETQGLIRFDNLFGTGAGQILSGVQITSAQLTVEVTDNTSGTISLHRMLTSWSESSTWNSLTAGLSPDDVEMASVADSQLTSPSGTATFTGLAATVQRWANGQSNHGWGLLTDSTDGWDFRSSENGSGPPLLTIEYIQPGSQTSTNHTLVVDTTADVHDGDTTSIDALLADKGSDGKISLREAIWAANHTTNDATPDAINFAIGSGLQTITLVDALPQLTDSVVIDATTQSGYVGAPLIELDGSATANFATAGFLVGTDNSTISGFIINGFDDEGIKITGSSGHGSGSNNTISDNWIGIDSLGNAAANGDNGILLLGGASNNTIQNNVISGNTGAGIEIRGSGTSNNVISGNTIGLSPDGSTAVANGGHGIQIHSAADGNIIGTNDDGIGDAAEQNVISGNALDGINLDNVANTVIKGNLIGTDATGTVAIGNGDEGISIQNSSSNTTIGGSNAVARNVISGNAGSGMLIQGGASGTTIQGNYIGTDLSGTLDLGNAKLAAVGEQSGIRFSNAGAGNSVGGTGAGEGNLIAFNAMHGVEVIGTSVGVRIRGNSIHSNTGIGIDLSGGTEDANLVTANDSGDGDSGPNDLQNFPLLTKAALEGTSIYLAGSLNTSGNSTYHIDFYASATADASGYGEAERYLGSTTATTDVNGYAHFYTTLTAAVSAGEFITATATNSGGSTSEFAANLAAYAPGSSLWLTTSGNVTSPSGATGLDKWTAGEAIQLSNPNLNLEPGTTSGTFSSRLNLDAFAADSDATIDGIHYVASNITVGGGANTFDLLAGDLLLSTGSDETLTSLNSVAVKHGDVFVYRPGAANDYTSGTFYKLLDDFGTLHGTTDTWSLTLIEQDTVIGDATVSAGTFLFSQKGGGIHMDVRMFSSTGVGEGSTTGTFSTLINGEDIGVSSKIWGLDVAETAVTVGGHTISAGSILLSLENDDTYVGSNGIAATAQDIWYVEFSQTTLVSGTSVGNATLLMDGSDVGLDSIAEAINGFTLTPQAPPTVGLPGGSLSYTENDGPVVIDGTATVADPDSANFDTGSLTVDFTAGSSGEDRLAIRNQGIGTGQIGISGSDVTYNFGSGAVVIGTYTGGTDGSDPLIVTLNANSDVTSVQALLRNIAYENVSEDPDTTTRTVRFVLTDGDGGTSDAQTETINVAKANDAPLLAASAPSLTTITEDDTSNNGHSVATLLGTSLSDVDSGAAEGIAITGLSSSNGDWQYSTDGGTTWNAVGAVASDNALLLAATGRVRFVPNGQNADAASFDFRGWDQTSGTAGTKADTTTNGGTTAFSTATDTADITVTAVNDAPVLTASAPSLTTITEDDTSNNGDSVSSLLGASLSDVDSGAVEGIAITDLSSSNGIWQYSTDGGTTWNGVGAVANSSALLLAAADRVRFVPDGQNADTASFNFRGWDQTSGTAGTKVDTTTNGGTTAFSTATDTADITVTAVNDAPVTATIEAAPLEYTENDSPTAVTDTTTISDFDDTHIDNAVIQITGNYASGQDVLAFTDTGSITGNWNSTSGTLTLTGSDTLANYEAALRSVTYQNTSDDPSTLSRTVSFTVNDGDANSSASSRDIAVTAVNDSPTVGTNTGLTVNEGSTGNAITAAMLDEGDPDDSGTGLIYTITTAAGNGTLRLNGTAMAVNDTFTQNDIDNNRVTYDHDDSETTSDSFTFSLADGGEDGATAATGTFNLTITPVNDNSTTAVTDTDGTANAVDENASLGTAVGVTALADDADAADSVSYSLDDDDGGRFAIDANTGVVTVAGGIDRETDGASRSVTVRATSTDGSFTTESFTIAVNDVDEVDATATTDSDAAVNEVDENASIGTTVGVTALAADADATDTVSYSLDDDDGGRFAIDTNTGVVTVAGAINRETDGVSRSIAVRATSTDGSFTTEAFTIAVNDVNEFVTAIADTDAAAPEVDENAAVGTTVGITAFAEDEDATDSISYSLDDDDGGRFAIDANTGAITVAGGIDREADGPSRSITVRATSTDGSSRTQDFTVAIRDLNDTAPIVTPGQTLSIDEAAANGQVVGSVLAADADTVGTLQDWTIDSGDPSGIFAIDSATGQITIADNTALDYEMVSQYELVVRVSDGAQLSTPQTVTVNIQDVNEAPTVTTAEDAIVYLENDPPRLVFPEVSIIDPDSSFIQSATVTLVGYLADQDVIHFTDSEWISGSWDSTTGRLTLSGVATAADYESALQSVAYSNSSETPSTDTRAITVVAFDGVDFSNVSTAPIDVISVNDAPIAVADSYSTRANESLTVDAPGVLANDFDADGDALFPVIVTSPLSGQTSIDDQGRLVYTPTPGFFGTDVIQYRASDGMAASETVEIRIEVTAVTGGLPPAPINPPATNATPSEVSDSAPTDSTADDGSQSQDGEDSSAQNGRGITPIAAGLLSANSQSPQWMQIASKDDSHGVDSSQQQYSGNETSDAEQLDRRNMEDRMLGGNSDHSAMQLEMLQQLLRADIEHAIGWDRWDEIRQRAAQESSFSNFAVGAVDATAAIASVGYAMWAIRGSVFVTSMFGSLPAWRLVDPASMLLAYRNRRVEDGDAVERMMT